jgi:uncharacterized membrane protein
MKDFFKNPKLKNPYFWLSIVSLIFASAGINFDTLTSWNLLADALLSILNNPVSIMTIIGALIGIWNNNDTKGLDKIKNKK